MVTWAVRDRRPGQRSHQAESGLAGWELASGPRLENEGRAPQEQAVAVMTRFRAGPGEKEEEKDALPQVYFTHLRVRSFKRCVLMGG